MNRKHLKVLDEIFTEPTLKQLEWKAIESLLLSLGAHLIEEEGSRIRFKKFDETAYFHRPHPHKEAKPYQVENARHFLQRIGITP